MLLRMIERERTRERVGEKERERRLRFTSEIFNNSSRKRNYAAGRFEYSRDQSEKEEKTVAGKLERQGGRGRIK